MALMDTIDCHGTQDDVDREVDPSGLVQKNAEVNWFCEGQDMLHEQRILRQEIAETKAALHKRTEEL